MAAGDVDGSWRIWGSREWWEWGQTQQRDGQKIREVSAAKLPLAFEKGQRARVAAGMRAVPEDASCRRRRGRHRRFPAGRRGWHRAGGTYSVSVGRGRAGSSCPAPGAGQTEAVAHCCAPKGHLPGREESRKQISSPCLIWPCSKALVSPMLFHCKDGFQWILPVL